MIYAKKKKGVSIVEIWYLCDASRLPKADVYRYKFSASLPDNAQSVEELATLEIDLRKNTDELWNDVAKNTRYEINRAKERDPVSAGTFLAPGERADSKLESYIDFFNGFARSKGRSDIEYSDLAQFYEAGTLSIRSCSHVETGDLLVMHAYVVSDGRARLFQSCSHFRNADDSEYRKMAARANRLLHWDDILCFKESGIETYDLGGWYRGGDDQEKALINRFKESFGGVVRSEYSCIVPASLRGRLSLFARNALKRKK